MLLKIIKPETNVSGFIIIIKGGILVYYLVMIIAKPQ